MKQSIIFSTLLLASTMLHAQQISKVQFGVNSNKVEVYYNISNAQKEQSFDISLFLSQDGGQTYNSIQHQLSGDIGNGIKRGANKVIVWDVLQDPHYGRLVGSSIRFKVRAQVDEGSYIGRNFTVAIPSTKLNIAMRGIQGGSFQMGSNDGYSYEKPVHTVNLGKFAMARYEVTNAEFCAFLNEKGNQTEGGVEWIDLDGSWSNNGTTEKCRIYKSGFRSRMPLGNRS